MNELQCFFKILKTMSLKQQVGLLLMIDGLADLGKKDKRKDGIIRRQS